MFVIHHYVCLLIPVRVIRGNPPNIFNHVAVVQGISYTSLLRAILCYPILSYPILSYPILSYPMLAINSCYFIDFTNFKFVLVLRGL